MQGLRSDGEQLPRSIDAIKADPELADWREDADRVLIPLLLDRGSSQRINISLDGGLLEAIDDEARRRRVTRSAFLAPAARHDIAGMCEVRARYAGRWRVPEETTTLRKPDTKRRGRWIIGELRGPLLFRLARLAGRTDQVDGPVRLVGHGQFSMK